MAKFGLSMKLEGRLLLRSVAALRHLYFKRQTGLVRVLDVSCSLCVPPACWYIQAAVSSRDLVPVPARSPPS